MTGIIQGNTNAGGGTNLLIFLDSAADFYLDDITLVPGSEPAVGTSVLQNGDFESPLSGPWVVSPVYSNSVISSTVAHSGNGSLHVLSSGPASTLATSIYQKLAGVVTNTTYTLSYWYRTSANGTNLTVRTFPGSLNIQSRVNIRPVFSSPGAANANIAALPPYPPLWINELQPNNLTCIVDNNGQNDPWLELYNSGTNDLSLDGFYLANNFTNLALWPFPSGSTIAAGEFRIIWADGETNQTTLTEWHANFRLNSATGAVALARIVATAPQIVDYIKYGNIGADLSYGSFPDGQSFDRRIFQIITPGYTNYAPRVSLFINEWMASNTNTIADPSEFPNLAFDDWFEIYNPGPDAVALDGYWLTDNLSNARGFQVPSNGVYVIPPGGFLLVWADADSAVNSSNLVDLHVNFRLNASREDIGLFAPDLTLIDGVSFTNQVSDISQGRFADGASAIYRMTTPTPRRPNTLGGGNSPPQLAGIADQIVTLGQTLSFTASASDPEAPPQTLSFSLEANIPSGAMIGAASGLFTWTPSAQQSPSTNAITVRVTDTGAPPLSAARSLMVFVVGPPRISGITPPLSGVVTLTLPAIAGKTYRVEYKTNLNESAWSPLGGSRFATSASLTIDDDIGSQPQRFYRVLVAD
jgi:hypothetical protein